MKNPMPSSPIRPPKFVLYIINDEERGAGAVVNFAEAFGAKKYLDEFIRKDKTKWLNKNEISVAGKYTIRCVGLEDLMEYEYKGEEKKWELPEPYPSDIARLRGEEPKRKRMDPEEKTEKALSKMKKDQVGGSKTPRPSKDGLISIGEICANLKIEPRVARGILRAKKEEKPDAGWAWPKKEAAQIEAMIKKELKS